MEYIHYPATRQEEAATIADVAESLASQGELITAQKLAYRANWTLRYAECALQWYAGLLRDARLAADGRVPAAACWPLTAVAR